jgi:hypothetical protein
LNWYRNRKLRCIDDCGMWFKLHHLICFCVATAIKHLFVFTSNRSFIPSLFWRDLSLSFFIFSFLRLQNCHLKYRSDVQDISNGLEVWNKLTCKHFSLLFFVKLYSFLEKERFCFFAEWFMFVGKMRNPAKLI